MSRFTNHKMINTMKWAVKTFFAKAKKTIGEYCSHWFQEKVSNRVSRSISTGLPSNSFSSSELPFYLWACEEIEEQINALFKDAPVTIWVYGDSIAVFSFLLLSRDRVKVKIIRSFHNELEDCNLANTFLDHWVFNQWKFRALNYNYQSVQPTGDLSQFASGTPDLIISLSSNPGSSMDWWNNTPSGPLVLVVGRDQSKTLKFEELDLACENFSKRFSGLYIYRRASKRVAFGSNIISKHLVVGIKDK